MDIVKKRTSKAFNNHKARAAKDGKELTFSLQELRDITEIGSKCPYCLEPITEANFSYDHITPIDRDGTYNLDNLIVSCMTCNQIKSTLTAQEFMQLLGLLRAWEDRPRKNVLSRLKAGARICRV